VVDGTIYNVDTKLSSSARKLVWSQDLLEEDVPDADRPDSFLRAGLPSTSSDFAREIVITPTTARRGSSASPEEPPIEVPRDRLTPTTLSRKSLDVSAEVRDPWITALSPGNSDISRRT
jgi:hypothetical protein